MQTVVTIFYFNWFLEVLYHIGVMQWAIVELDEVLQSFVSTTAAESMNAAANIFVGHVSTAPMKCRCEYGCRVHEPTPVWMSSDWDNSCANVE